MLLSNTTQGTTITSAEKVKNDGYFNCKIVAF